MSKLWTRWILIVALSVAAFLGCWAGLKFGARTDDAVALGWAILPFSVLFALGGVWADAPRRDKGHADSKQQRISQNQRAGNKSQQIQIGGDLRISDKGE